MAGGLFDRLKLWKPFETVLNTDLNAEFNNVIAKLKASLLSGHSVNVAEMQETATPGAVGTESLSTSIADELKRLRYQVDLIIGGAQWYEAPAVSLTDLNTSVQGLQTIPRSRIVSGRKDANNQPMFLVAHGTLPTVTLKATATALQAYINGTARTFSADIAISTLQTAPSSNNTCLVNDTALAGAQVTKTLGERGTFIPIDTIGSEISSLNGKYAAFKKGSEYFIAEVDTTNNRLKNCIRGVGFSSLDAWQPRETVSDNATITLMKLTWLFGTYNSSTAGFALVYTKPTVAYAQPSGPAIGDYWYDIANATWKTYDGAGWNSTEAVLLGVAIQDSSGCVSARSFDFFKAHNALNTLDLEFSTTAIVRASRLDSRVSVYGTTFHFDATQPLWSTALHMDSGVSLGASTKYWAYVTDLGDVKISDVAPHERKFDLLGQYHPSKPWRSVGEFTTDSGSLIVLTTVAPADGVISKMMLDRSTTTSSAEISNGVVVASVASSALTLALKTLAGTDPSPTDPVTISFRSATATLGTYVRRQVTAPTSVVVSSGSTLGHVSGAEWPLYLYAIDNAGTVELAVTTSPLDVRSRITTTAEGGAGAADGAGVVYSTTARTTVGARLIAVMKSTQTTAGTWAAVPTSLSLSSEPSPFAQLVLRNSHTTVGIGGIATSASSGNYSSTGTGEADVDNLSVTLTTGGGPVRLALISDGSANTSSVRSNLNSTTGNTSSTFIFKRDSVAIANLALPSGENDLSSNFGQDFPPGVICHIEPVLAPGTYTWKLTVKSASAITDARVKYCKLVVSELT